MTEKFLVVYYRFAMLVEYRMDNNAFIIHSLLYKHTLRLYLQTSILHVVTCTCTCTCIYRKMVS